MRAVIQRVSLASVSVNNSIVGQIEAGFLVLLGIENKDTMQDVEYLINKIISLRIFDDKNQMMNLSIKDIDGEILVISQFTLHALIKNGNRPSYIKAAPASVSEPIYNQFISTFEKTYNKPIQKGVFGANMKVSLINEGPVTIIIDSKLKDF
jgi:D-aminoacyl-tRNA deacylase